MQAIIEFVRNEPVRVFNVVVALLAVAGSFGLPLTLEQQGAVLALAAVLLGIGEGVRSQVTPTRKLPPTK